MHTRRSRRRFALPQRWPRYVKSALLHAISLAAVVLTVARSRVATDDREIRRLQVELVQAYTEIALLREELSIKDARWRRLHSRRRPHFNPIQRMRILQVKAARRWNREQTARAFLVDEQTLQAWMRRVDEQGEWALIQTSEPVNRFPDFVRYLVKQLKALLPTMGKVRLANLLARAGLHLGATTIQRFARETGPLSEEALAFLPENDGRATRVVTASAPGRTWHVDLTAVPTWTGFWVPWMPFALPQSWPFCWWVAVAVDHFSRAVVGFAVFYGRPTAAEVQQFLDRAIQRAGHPPRYIISDKGRQFWCDSYRQWCRRHGIRPRFEAVGKCGSIAVVERFMRSLKNECTRRLLVPLSLDAVRREIALYVHWYHEHRPSMALGGSTPREVHDGARPANAKPRFEPRRKWPTRSPCASPQAPVNGEAGARLNLVVSYLEDRKHLPIVDLRHVA